MPKLLSRESLLFPARFLGCLLLERDLAVPRGHVIHGYLGALIPYCLVALCIRQKYVARQPRLSTSILASSTTGWSTVFLWFIRDTVQPYFVIDFGNLYLDPFIGVSWLSNTVTLDIWVSHLFTLQLYEVYLFESDDILQDIRHSKRILPEDISRSYSILYMGY